MRNGAARSVLHPPLPGPQGGREQTNFAAGPDPTSQASDLILDYAPRRQFVPFHQRKERFACIVTHRRAGKTVACIQDLQRGATSCENLRPRFAYSRAISFTMRSNASDGSSKPSSKRLKSDAAPCASQDGKIVERRLLEAPIVMA
jgi:hypothetical protein